MKKYNPNGKPKDDKEQAEHCSTCKDGEHFVGLKPVRTQKYMGDTWEPICGVCNTKYKVPRIDAPRIIEEGCLDCPSCGEHKCERNPADTTICLGNLLSYLKKEESREQEARTAQVDMDFLMSRKIFEETGICKDHRMFDSLPMKTSEGSFVFHTCLVCGKGTSDYKGLKNDKKNVLIEQIASNGMAFEKIAQVKEQTLVHPVHIDIKPINILDLFKREPNAKLF